jgi:hypothetical protein
MHKRRGAFEILMEKERKQLTMKETITLSLGSFASHVGCHYWNMQSEIFDASEDMDHESYAVDRLFRKVGQGKNASYQPRAIITDLRENLGYMEFEKEGKHATDFFDDRQVEDDSTGIWGGNITRIRTDAPKLSPFQAFLRDSSPASYSASAGAGAGTSNSNTETQAAAPPPVPSRQKMESTIKNWTDYSTNKISDKNLCMMPTWCTASNFDSFMSTTSSNFGQENSKNIINQFIDDYLENIRVLAEECDSLTTIQWFCDTYDGFSGLSSLLAEEIKQDYKNVTIPVYALNKSPPIKSTNSMYTNQNMTSQLTSLSSIYFYSQIIDNVSVVVPIECGILDLHSNNTQYNNNNNNIIYNKSNYHNSAIVAAAIEGLVSPTYLINNYDASYSASGTIASGTSRMDPSETYDMVYNATVGGRVPLCHLETCFPFTSYPDSNHYNFLQSLPSSNEDDGSGRGKGSGRDKRDSRVEDEQGTIGGLNPFMFSLSSAKNGYYKAKNEQRIKSYQYKRMSNVIRIRGPSSENLPKMLFSRCETNNFLITSILQKQSALYLPKSYPHFFANVNEFGFIDESSSISESTARSDNEFATTKAHSGSRSSILEPQSCSSMTLMSALGTDTDMGIHISNVAKTWDISTKDTSLKAQLGKGNIWDEECNEISECLHKLATCYTNE